MTVELRPLGVACNMHCSYCYQEPMRQFGQSPIKIDVDKMLDLAESTKHEFNLFGGEALLTPKKVLEKIWERGYALYGANGLQTSGALIDDDHIEMFKKYNVHIGVSIDGPNDLNGLRKVRGKEGDDTATLEATNKTIENIRKCVASGLSVSVILTLHRLNGTKENLDRLLTFISWLGDVGVTSGNVHVLEVDHTLPDQEVHVLSQEENIQAFLKMAAFFEGNPKLSYSPFRDIKKAFLNEYQDYQKEVRGVTKEVRDGLICFYNRCDPMNTQAVFGIEGDGQITNCGRTNKEGIDFSKAGDQGYERYISLYHTPQEHGGCQGCPFFLLCSGGCPGEGEDYDLRNKTIHCQTNQALFGYYEDKALRQGKIPFSRMNSRKDMEHILINELIKGHSPQLRDLIDHINKHPVVRSVGIMKDVKGEVVTIEAGE